MLTALLQDARDTPTQEDEHNTMDSTAFTGVSLRGSLAAFLHDKVYRNIFAIIAAVCALFVAFTTLAMALYPGGAGPIRFTHGYLFFVNTFSDLGQIHTQSGASNYPSMLLFTTAMVTVGLGLGAFFVAFARFFHAHSPALWARRANLSATLVGVVAALGFVGVGLTPHDRFFLQHQAVTQWTFRLLLVAMILEMVALRLERRMPVSLLRVNTAFVIVLAGYLMVMFFGPSPANLIGTEVHAVSQKLIVYTSIGVIFAQALLVRTHMARLLPAVIAE